MIAARLAAAFLLAACGDPPAPATPVPKAEPTSCQAAEDCALVEACCGCNAGGRRVAIRKDAVADHDASRARRCGDSVCTTVTSNHSSCEAEAGCENGTCTVLPHMGGL